MNEPVSPQIFEPVELPCGLVLPNRLVKASTYEHLAALFGGPPNSALHSLYARWARGCWGMICTGNVQVAADHLTLGRDMVVPPGLDDREVAPFTALAKALHCSPDTLAIMQISHAGRQSPNILGGRSLFSPAVAPSAIALGGHSRDGWLARLLYRTLFPTPRELSSSEINRVIERFIHGAKLAAAADFDGVELHAAHGYLLSEFLSVKTNARDDVYSLHREPLHLLNRIVTGIRDAVHRRFAIGVKLSSSDYIEASSTAGVNEQAAGEERILGYIREIATWGMVDFIEISGGDYENPDFMLTSRQAFFARFSRRARDAVQGVPLSRRPLILLTGGLRSADMLQEVLEQKHADLLGLARAAVLSPDLPARLAAGPGLAADTIFPRLPELTYPDTLIVSLLSRTLHLLGVLPLPKLIGAGVGMAWYTVMLRRLAEGRYVDYGVGGLGAVFRMWGPELRYFAAVVVLLIALVALWAWPSRA
ncbi:FMN-linked oxidoreductase [Peniophora sp. CONT]|nr:FMN-linked oxidoreductase [Peniophora sp. CONT]